MYIVYRGGYNSIHPQHFDVTRPAGIPCYALLHIKSRSYFIIDRKTMVVEPGHMVLISPNTPYHYRGLDGEYKNDWLHFDCDNSDLSKERLLFNEPIPLANPAHFSLYFQQLLWEMNYAGPDYKDQNIEWNMRLLINNLLQTMEATSSKFPYSPYASRLQNMRLTMQTQVHHDYTPQELASVLGISPSHFQHLYKDFFGLPFRADLINMRIEHAKELILSTNLKLDQVAVRCGYANEQHFYRQFRQKTGMTPKEFLKSTNKYASRELTSDSSSSGQNRYFMSQQRYYSQSNQQHPLSHL